MRNIIFAFILFGIVFLGGCTNQQIGNVAQEQVTEKEESIETRTVSLKPVDYIPNQITLEVPHKMIYENVRWNSSILTFYSKIKENTSLQIIRDAVDIWNKEADGLIKFVEIEDSQKAYFIIRYATSGEYQEKKTAAITVTLGEARLSTVDTEIFNLTTSAEMLFTPTTGECENKITAVHELGHVLGFAHVSDVRSVMFPQVDCSERITDEMKQTLRNLYAIESLPDLYFGVVKAEKAGKYIVLNFTIWNRGLVKSENVTVEIKVNGDVIKTYELPPIEPSMGWMTPDVIYIEKEFDSLILHLDSSDGLRELDKENNIIELRA